MSNLLKKNLGPTQSQKQNCQWGNLLPIGFTTTSSLLSSWDLNPQPCALQFDASSGSSGLVLLVSDAQVRWLNGGKCAWAPSGCSFQVWCNPDSTQCFESIQTAASNSLDYSTALPVLTAPTTACCLLHLWLNPEDRPNWTKEDLEEASSRPLSIFDGLVILVLFCFRAETETETDKCRRRWQRGSNHERVTTRGPQERS